MHNQIQKELQAEAEEILNDESLWKPFTDHGIIHPVGSYALGLLVYGDLDVYYEPTDPNDLIDILSNGMHTAAHLSAIKTIRFERELYKKVPKLPPGSYLQYNLEVKSGRIWQIDIWCVDKDTQERFLQEFELMKSKLTPQNRELILKVKHHVMGSMGKTPSFCSFNIYKAILEEGLEDLNEIKDYLRSQGIQLF